MARERFTDVQNVYVVRLCLVAGHVVYHYFVIAISRGKFCNFFLIKILKLVKLNFIIFNLTYKLI